MDINEMFDTKTANTTNPPDNYYIELAWCDNISGYQSVVYVSDKDGNLLEKRDDLQDKGGWTEDLLKRLGKKIDREQMQTTKEVCEES